MANIISDRTNFDDIKYIGIANNCCRYSAEKENDNFILVSEEESPDYMIVLMCNYNKGTNSELLIFKSTLAYAKYICENITELNAHGMNYSFLTKAQNISFIET